MAELSILLIGDTSRAEFRDAVAGLRSAGRLDAPDGLAAAEDPLRTGQAAPDAIVLAQSFPGQFTPEAVDRLRRLAPLARVLGLLGSWCEGEMRTGRPWPGAIRVYWHQWPARAAQELARLADGDGSSWALPVTASEEERALVAADVPIEPRSGAVAVRSPEFEMQAWLAEACRRRGYSTAWLRPGEVPEPDRFAAGVFDAVECDGAELAELRRFSEALRPAPVIALLDFPRAEDRDRALTAGAAAVLSKPLAVEDLFWQLDQVVHVPPPVDTAAEAG